MVLRSGDQVIALRREGTPMIYKGRRSKDRVDVHEQAAGVDYPVRSFRLLAEQSSDLAGSTFRELRCGMIGVIALV